VKYEGCSLVRLSAMAGLRVWSNKEALRSQLRPGLLPTLATVLSRRTPRWDAAANPCLCLKLELRAPTAYNGLEPFRVSFSKC